MWTGDNLPVLRGLNSDCIDLIYLDPPFNSNRNYAAPIGSEAAGAAFKDTWTLSDVDEAWHGEIAEREPKVYAAIDAAGIVHGPGMKSYLIMMAVRMLEMRRVLKPTGSLYLHCDPTASHYLKVMMDSVFGHENCLGEVVWKRTSAHSKANRPGPIHDVLLMYGRSDNYVWNSIHQKYDKTYVDEFYTHQDPDGRRWRRSDLTGAGTRDGKTGEPWRGIDITAKGRHWARPPAELDRLDSEGKIHWPKKRGGMPMFKRYLDEQPGVPLQDVWTDIRPIHNLASDGRFPRCRSRHGPDHCVASAQSARTAQMSWSDSRTWYKVRVSRFPFTMIVACMTSARSGRSPWLGPEKWTRA